MEDKRKNLVISKQKELVSVILKRLQDEHPSFYYLSTSEIAHEIIQYAEEPERLTHDEAALLNGLSARDIQMIMSLHN